MSGYEEIRIGNTSFNYNTDPKISGHLDRKWAIKECVERYAGEIRNHDVFVNKEIVNAYRGACGILGSQAMFVKFPQTKELTESMKQSLETLNTVYLTQLEEQYKKRVAEHKQLMEYVREL